MIECQESLSHATALFVSPHFDDAALSCGGTLGTYVARGESVAVVTVFTEGPPPGAALGAFARSFTVSCGLEATESDRLWQLRKEEDTAAMRRLGCAHRWLPYRDAIYRGHYEGVFSLLGTVSTGDRPIIDDIEADILRLWHTTPRAKVYLPLGVGRHVDHQICYQLGGALGRAAADVRYYEDFPYAYEEGAVGQRLRELGVGMFSQSIDVSSQLDRRIAAIREYATQIPGLFGRADDVDVAVKSFASVRSPKPGSYGERIWSAGPFESQQLAERPPICQSARRA
jgi:LmbE family N-acetylglucosaminyl deacetylase